MKLAAYLGVLAVVFTGSRKRRSSVLLAVAILTAPAVAAAKGDPASPDYEPETPHSEPARRQWYGTPLVIADAGAFALIAGGLGLAMRPGTHPEVPVAMLITGGAVYALDGAVVHAVNGQTDRAVESVVLRLGLAASMGAGGWSIGGTSARGCGEQDCGIAYAYFGLMIGMGTGMVAASIIDNALLAYKHPANAGERTLLIAPVIDPRGGIAGLGVSGTW
jgi:hypothetical protein